MLTLCDTCGIKNGSKQLSFDVNRRLYLGRGSIAEYQADSLTPSAGWILHFIYGHNL